MDEDTTTSLENAVKKIIFTEEINNTIKDEVEKGDSCSICLESIDIKPCLIMTTECGHKFHYRECWKKYYEGRDDSKINNICRPCPMCRRLIMFENGGYFNTLDYIKALEEAILDAVDIEFQPLFYENEDNRESDIERIIELIPSNI